MTLERDFSDENISRSRREGYSWEESYKRSWDALKEDESGSLGSSVRQLQKTQHAFYKSLRQKERNLLIQRGILRYLVVVVDATLSMTGDKTDFSPNSRWQITHKIISKWIQEYTDQNPMSQLAGIELTDEGQADVWSSMDGRSPILLDRWKLLQDKVTKRSQTTTGTSGPSTALSKRNNPSLQKGLEMALNILSRYPSHASREIICIMADLSTNDPSNLSGTIGRLESRGIRTSVISLAAETRIFKHIAERTYGDYYVILDECHYDEIMMAMALPPPRVLLSHSAEIASGVASQMIEMAFPRQVIKKKEDVCFCHIGNPREKALDAVNVGYQCPRCAALVCQVPFNCPVCGIMLVLAPHLARSYHHLFPLPVFEASCEDPGKTITIKCHGCNRKSYSQESSSSLDLQKVSRQDFVQCPNCLKNYCLDCDLYIHNTLHQCPTCLST